jgi:hypothetical protein
VKDRTKKKEIQIDSIHRITVCLGGRVFLDPMEEADGPQQPQFRRDDVPAGRLSTPTPTMAFTRLNISLGMVAVPPPIEDGAFTADDLALLFHGARIAGPPPPRSDNSSGNVVAVVVAAAGGGWILRVPDVAAEEDSHPWCDTDAAATVQTVVRIHKRRRGSRDFVIVPPIRSDACVRACLLGANRRSRR